MERTGLEPLGVVQQSPGQSLLWDGVVINITSVPQGSLRKGTKGPTSGLGIYASLGFEIQGGLGVETEVLVFR